MAPFGYPAGAAGLLDLALAKLDVLLGDRVVLLLDQLLGLRARVLLGDVVEARIGARHQLDFDGRGLGHGGSSERATPGRGFAGKLAGGVGKSRNGRSTGGGEPAFTSPGHALGSGLN